VKVRTRAKTQIEGEKLQMIKQAKTTPLTSEFDKAARRLAGTTPERKAFIELLKQEAIANAMELKKATLDGVNNLYDARSILSSRTFDQLAKGLRLALALSRSTKELNAFYEHKFWNDRRPNKAKLLLHCLQFALPPRNDLERKQLSRQASAVGWLVLQGYGPDNLAAGIKEEGGFSACATKLAGWRRKRKSRVQGDRTIREDMGAAGRAKSVSSADAAGAHMKSAAVKLPIWCGKALRQKIEDREPPANRDEFWGRILHRGDRISIVEIAPSRTNSSPKALSLAKPRRNRALPVNSSRRKNAEFRRRRKLLAEARRIVMASIDRRLG
jgi:hypothetical protein